MRFLALGPSIEERIESEEYLTLVEKRFAFGMQPTRKKNVNM
jgi:hypothetical protein